MRTSLITAAALLVAATSPAWPAGAARAGLSIRVQPGRLSFTGALPSAAALPATSRFALLPGPSIAPLAAPLVQPALAIAVLSPAPLPVLPAAEAPAPVLEPLRQAWGSGVSPERIFDNSSRLAQPEAAPARPTAGGWRSAARWVADRFRTRIHIHRFTSPPAPAASPFLSEPDGAALTFSAMTPLRGTILKGLKGIFGARGGLSASLREERRFLHSVYTLTFAGPAFMVEAALRDIDDWFAYLEWS